MSCPRALVAALLTATAAVDATAQAAPTAGGGDIAVDVDTQECPARSDLLAALEARLPGFAPGAGQAGTRRLSLDRPAGQGRARLRLTDAAGNIELERQLELAAGAGSRLRAVERCAALAEAAAQVVARYLKEIGYRPPSVAEAPAVPEPAAPPAVVEAPPPPSPPSPPPSPVITVKPPPPRRAAGGGVLVSVVLGGGERVGLGGVTHWSRSELTLGLELRRRWFAASLAAGVSAQATVAIPGTSPDAALLLRGYPVRAAVGAAIPVDRGGTLLPAVGVSLDWMDFQSGPLDGARRGRRFDPALEAGVGYSHRWGHLVVGLRLAGGLALIRHDFVSERQEPVFQTQGGYLRALVETGFVLGKDS